MELVKTVHTIYNWPKQLINICDSTIDNDVDVIIMYSHHLGTERLTQKAEPVFL